MGEFVSSHDIPIGELVAATPVEREITLPPAHALWTVLVTPKHDGGGSPNDASVEVKYGVGDDYFPSNPGGGASVATINKANIISREDAINRIKLVVTPGANPQVDGGILIRLFMSRS